MTENLNDGWRKFQYVAPYVTCAMMLSLKRPDDKRYRLRLPTNLSIMVRAPLYDYRYVKEFVQAIGYINAVIASSADPHLCSPTDDGSTHLAHICSFMDKYLTLDFDYEELSKELWDDQQPDLLCDPTLWQVYKDAKVDVISNFQRMVESYKHWSSDRTSSNFEELVAAFNDFLEVK